MGFSASAMYLAESMTAGNQCDGFFVVHRHPGERFTNVMGRRQRIGMAVRPLRIHIDEAHLNGSKRRFQLAIPGISLVVQPDIFGSPIDVFLRLPHVCPPAGETKCLESHRFEGAVAGQNHQVGPGNLIAVFLFDRPKQAAGLVEVDVVRPAVQRRETLCARRCATPPVTGAVGACAVPGHPDEKWAVMAIVGGPPILAVGHQGEKIGLQRLDIKFLEGVGVVEGLTHRIGQGGILVQNFQTQLIGPPVAVGADPGGGMFGRPVYHRASACVPAIISVHRCLPSWLYLFGGEV